MPTKWEKFAPGPVRRVTVASAPLADPAQPKKRGRPPKRKDETIAPKEGEQIFGPMSKRRSQVVPPIDAVVPVDLFVASGAPSGAPPEKVAWPTRATFAERKKPGGEEAAMVFETRRSKFYESVPSDLWRDGLESDWNECVKCGSEGEAVDTFLKNHGPGHSTRASSSRLQSQDVVPGRNRGRVRGRALKP